MAQRTGSNIPQAVSQFPDPPYTFYATLGSDGVPLPAPPQPPAGDQSYNMFGRLYATTDRLPSLPEAGRPCLYDESKPVSEELRRLNRTLMTLFSSLVVRLSIADGNPGDIVGRIEDVFINMHHLLNTLRPAQAIRDLRALLIQQAASRRRVAGELNEAILKAEDAISDAAAELRNPGPARDEAETEAKALRIVQEQLAKPLKDIRTTDKLGWYRNPSAPAIDMDKGKDDRHVPGSSNTSAVSGNSHAVEITDAILAEFARIVDE